MKLKFSNTERASVLISVQYEKGVHLDDLPLSDVDKALMTRALSFSSFEQKHGQDLCVYTAQNDDIAALVFIGAGKVEENTDLTYQNIGAHVYKTLSAMGVVDAVIRLTAPQIAAQIAYGATLAAYRFDQHKTVKTAAVSQLEALIVDCDGAEACFEPLGALSRGVFTTRDLVSQASNILSPPAFSEQICRLERDGLEIEVLGEAALSAHGMRALLAVGAGSHQESQVVIARWPGSDPIDRDPLVLIGKGVTFDSGGISIKPAFDMADMTGDMGGAAAVIGTLHALAKRKARRHVVGIVGLVENMPGGNAMRPGDVVRTANGQTIEVRNTDCEGRMILADLLWLAQSRFKPDTIVDLATLTGSAVSALGNEFGAVLSDNDELIDSLILAGMQSGEKLWRLPLSPELDQMLNSDFADINNTPGRSAGASTAAHFIKRFVNPDQKWAHIDMAGMAYKSSGRKPTNPTWATGFGPRLLTQWIDA